MERQPDRLMKSHLRFLVIGACMLSSVSPQLEAQRGELFDRVVAVLAAGYYDTTFRDTRLPALAARWRPRALDAATASEERAAIRGLLAEIPATHLGLLSTYGRDLLVAELTGRPRPTVGLQLVRWQDHFYASQVLTGGPADDAGICVWDEVIAIDGAPPDKSARLDWSTDDAHLPDDRDPPVHAIVVEDGDRVVLSVASRPGAARDVLLAARPDSAIEAARRSARRIERGGHVIGYVHLWYLHMTGVPELIGAALDSTLADSEALVLDLRGRGGSASVVAQVLRLLESGPDRRFVGPVIALIDRQARSGKEVLAYELRARGIGRLVGEPTAGAAVPAAFADLEHAVLMYPPMALPTYSALLELRPTPPDVAVAWGGPHSGDRDPILEAGLDEAVREVGRRGPGRVRPAAGAVARVGQEMQVGPVPSLEELLRRMTEAYGGQAALDRHQGFEARGQARIVDTPIAGVFHSTATRPGRYESQTTLGGGIEIVQRRDGARVWVRQPGQKDAVDVGSAAAIPIVWLSLVAPPLELVDAFPDAVVEGSEAVRGVACVRVRLGGTGEGAVRVFVSATRWLPAELRFRAPSPLGTIDVVIRFDDYRDDDGVQIPHTISTVAAGQTTELTVSSFTWR